jgi:lipid A 3-O-deacylase
MAVPGRSFCWPGPTRWALVFWLAGGVAGEAADWGRLESVGFRAAFPSGESGKEFNEAEAALNWLLPWSWDLGRKWELDSRIDLSVGWLGDDRVNAALGTLGPSLLLHRDGFPLSLEVGFSPTLLSEHEFGTKDFGSEFQITSHIGVNWDVGEHVRFSGRFQHMSNGGLFDHNPGLNLWALGVSYLF